MSKFDHLAALKSPVMPHKTFPKQTAAELSSGLGLVSLSPPLPFVAADASTSGFVVGLSPTSLLLAFRHVPGGKAGISRLSIATDGGRSYSLNVSLNTASVPSVTVNEARHLAVVTGADSLQQLGDLLTLVRKAQHLHFCATTDVEASDRYTGFTDVHLVPCALPELSWNELDLSTDFLGTRFALPLLITGMTGGLLEGARINQRLAQVAAALNIPMGVGSQRIALENPEHAAIFAVKKTVPKVFLIGNIGIAQLLVGSVKTATSSCQKAVEMIAADALAIHVNVLQELIQVEGDRDFRGVFDRIAAVSSSLGVPVIVKEVGGGIDAATAKRLVECGASAIDCGGKGGTSWSYIEGMRAESPVTRAVAASFRDWGVPTAMATASLRDLLPRLPLIATGGIRDGLTVAKALALGANMCGIGLPLMRAAMHSDEAPLQCLETFVQGLKTAMLCVGARTTADLRTRLHVSANFRTVLAQHTSTVPFAALPVNAR